MLVRRGDAPSRGPAWRLLHAVWREGPRGGGHCDDEGDVDESICSSQYVNFMWLGVVCRTLANRSCSLVARCGSTVCDVDDDCVVYDDMFQFCRDTIWSVFSSV